MYGFGFNLNLGNILCKLVVVAYMDGNVEETNVVSYKLIEEFVCVQNMHLLGFFVAMLLSN